MNNAELMNIPKEKFSFHNMDAKIYDMKFDTKPIGYLKDAWLRFKRNKGSVVAACIILLLLLFAIIVPFITPYSVNYADQTFKELRPKSSLFHSWGWNGYNTDVEVGQARLDLIEAKGSFVRIVSTKEFTILGKTTVLYNVEYDTYKNVGFRNLRIEQREYDSIIEYQNASGHQVLFPLIDTSLVASIGSKDDANLWFLHDAGGLAIRDGDGKFIPIYRQDALGEDLYYEFHNEMLNTRINYLEYYRFVHGAYPEHLFGTDKTGKDILSNLAVGLRVSLLLAICVSVINLVIGTLWGATSGYYGGAVDLIMERIVDVLAGIPFIITAVLFNMHLNQHVGQIGALIFAFVLTGWIGTAGRVRTQFYRFKGQEYVLAARTLGAKNSRLIYRHILPNAIGTLITGSVLVIPGVIFTESSLSYLGIIKLDQEGFSSIGTMLANGQSVLRYHPHVIFFPAVVISLLMISFNIFGNGLRDAFNPALRGAEE